MRFPNAPALALFALAMGPALALALDDAPPTVPATRDEMKMALEGSKRAVPRLPLPPLSADEGARAGKGDWSVVNNGRMRKHYLGPELSGGGFPREPEPNMTLGHPFQTMLFWVVSRGNNCTYCMGHQEVKLAAAGLDEAKIAALDGDWSEFDDAQRAAFAFAKKLTFEPEAIADEDVNRLRSHYDDRQILEIAFVVGGFNGMNRWTGALKIPQEGHRVYLTPTAEALKDRASLVAPLDPTRTGPSCAAPSRRPKLESAAEVAEALAVARKRTPRLPLIPESEARALLPADWQEGPLPRWVRLLANFPKVGVARIVGHRAAEEKGTLDRTLRAQVAYIAARNDRAWYALGHARARLARLGQSEGAIGALDGDWHDARPAERAAFSLARKLTTDPALVTDADIAALRERFEDKQVAELVHQVAEAAFFDRVTEVAGLAPEGE